MRKALLHLFIFLVGVITPSAYGQTPQTSKRIKEIACPIVPLVMTAKGGANARNISDFPYPDMWTLKSQRMTFSFRSANWCGYLVATNLKKPKKHIVQKISGAWTVPKIAESTANTYSAVWIGMDGFSNGTIEQIGTSHNWVDGHQENYAWFEMFPNKEYLITGFPLDVGDSVSAEVRYVGDHTFKLFIVNHTQGVFAKVPSSYTKLKNAKRNTAEWIVEAPLNKKGQILSLANFSTISFTDCKATIKGKKGAIGYTRCKVAKIRMTHGNIVKAEPSALTSKGKSFDVTWSHE